MRIAATVSRILLGLLFLVAGASGFFFIANPPPAPPGLAGQFQDIFFASRWVLFVDGVEFVAAVLLLANRFVPIALLLLAGVLPNILVFHITMMPMGIFPGLIATLLWFVVALQYRSLFAPLFVARASIDR
ncbi:MAG: DoxX family membrane protein [Vulcanimicrobiaceae bacterium]